MKIPFISAQRQERAFRVFLVEHCDLTAAEIRRESVEDNEFLTRELTYTQVKEIFDAGWDAAERAIKRRN